MFQFTRFFQCNSNKLLLQASKAYSRRKLRVMPTPKFRLRTRTRSLTQVLPAALPFLILACLFHPHAQADNGATAITSKPPSQKYFDETNPPFGAYDYSWMNGNNRQPPSLLTTGPLTFELYVDGFYDYQFSKPKDHTIFPATVAARHNEFGINLATIGVEVTGLDGPIGRLYLQEGINTETDSGQDATTTRGYFLQQRSLLAIQQVGAGWHFHELDGINFEVGLFPSYVGLESYLPQENWNYLRPFLSDFTPYYFTGSRTQIFISPQTKLELWLVNGWQTYGKFNEAFGIGYLYNWRPNGHFSLSHSIYDGSEEPADNQSNRFYTDNYLQWQYYRGSAGGIIQSSAVSVVVDWGYETRGANNRGGANGPMYGTSISNRIEYSPKWATTLRYDYYYDKTQALVIAPPRASDGAQAAPIDYPNGPFQGSGYTATVDFLPSPWLIYRLEYMHREANFPIFSGHGGITSDNGLKGGSQNGFIPDLRQSDDRLVANVTLRL